MEVQERIHAALTENREHPENTKHAKIVKDTVMQEIENTRKFKRLIETSPSVPIPVSQEYGVCYVGKGVNFPLFLIILSRHKRLYIIHRGW